MHEKAKKKIDMMKHALGWPDCYRNQYCAGEGDIEIWDELVEEGSAVKHDPEWTVGPIYQVTPAGRAALHSIETHGTDSQAATPDGGESSGAKHDYFTAVKLAGGEIKKICIQTKIEGDPTGAAAFFELMGVLYPPADAEGLTEEEIIRILKQSANDFYHTYQHHLPFNRQHKYQIRKRPPEDHDRTTIYAWYYTDVVSAEGPGHNYIDMGSFFFR